MTAGELEEWLGTDESQAVGQKSGGSGESTGHESGRRIVELLHTKKADLTDDDLAHMRKVARLRAAAPGAAAGHGGRRDLEVAVLADELGPRPAEEALTSPGCCATTPPSTTAWPTSGGSRTGGFAMLHWLAASRGRADRRRPPGPVRCPGRPGLRRRADGAARGAAGLPARRGRPGPRPVCRWPREHGVLPVRGSVLAVPLADGCADVVVAGEVLEHVADDVRVITECAPAAPARRHAGRRRDRRHLAGRPAAGPDRRAAARRPAAGHPRPRAVRRPAPAGRRRRAARASTCGWSACGPRCAT